MVVKIVKLGKRPEEVVFTTTCRNCTTTFTFNPPDAKFNDDQRDGSYYSINCPVCGEQCTRSTKP